MYVTAHTAGAGTATVLRGQESSVARQHATGETWVQAATALDYWGAGGTWTGYQFIDGVGAFTGAPAQVGKPITGYLETNANQLASTTALNPGVLVFGGDAVNAVYGMDLGYSTVFGLRFFSGGVGNKMYWGYHTAGVATNVPDQSAFVETMRLEGAGGIGGLVVRGNTHLGGGTFGSSYAMFGYAGLAANSYAVLQGNGGDTYLNAAPGHQLILRNNNVTLASIDASGELTFVGGVLNRVGQLVLPYATALQVVGSAHGSARFGQYADGTAHVTINSYWDGTNWQRDAVVNGAAQLRVSDAQQLQFFTSQPAANPQTNLVELFRVDGGASRTTSFVPVQVNSAGATTTTLLNLGDHTYRNVAALFDPKDNADAGGAYWRMWADADNSVVGADQFAIWGYPRDTTGAALGNERFLSLGFLGGKAAGYTKYVTVTVGAAEPTRTAGAMSVGGKVGAVSTGTITGPGTVQGGMSFYDNDLHSWESDGVGGWIFRNAWNSAGAAFKFFGGPAGAELMRLTDSIASGTSLWLKHQGTGLPSTDQVTLGALDSGGAGFRVLRVPN